MARYLFRLANSLLCFVATEDDSNQTRSRTHWPGLGEYLRGYRSVCHQGVEHAFQSAWTGYGVSDTFGRKTPVFTVSRNISPFIAGLSHSNKSQPARRGSQLRVSSTTSRRRHHGLSLVHPTSEPTVTTNHKRQIQSSQNAFRPSNCEPYRVENTVICTLTLEIKRNNKDYLPLPRKQRMIHYAAQTA